MRLTCPNCLTEYDVPDAAVAGRSRMLRCAYCGHQWRNDAADGAATAPLEPAVVADEPAVVTAPVELEPAAPEPAAPIVDVPPLAPAPAAAESALWVRQDALAARLAAARQPAAPPPPRRASRVPAVVVLLAVLLAVVVVAAHAQIMQAWPMTAGFYRALGLK